MLSVATLIIEGECNTSNSVALAPSHKDFHPILNYSSVSPITR